MLTLNQTSGNNNQTIWVLKINTPTPIYLSTRDITLDAINYDGQVLNFDNYLTDITQTSTIPSGGGTGAVSSFGFSISRYVGNTSLDGFFNEFYPATSGVYLSGVLVQFGIVWEGATTEAEITWLMVGRIVDYQYGQRKLNITVFQESEISNKEVPYYSVQKDFNNGVSYFVGAPEDSYGLSLPIVYGDFTNGVIGNDYEISRYVLTPIICVNKRGHRFIVCSHKVHTTSEIGAQEFIFTYLGQVNSYLWIKNEDAANSSTDNMNGYCLINMKDRAGKLLGSLSVRLTDISALSDVDGIDNAIDNDITTYSDLDATVTGDNKLALRAIGSLNTSDVGFLGFQESDIIVFFRLSSNAASLRNLTVYYSNPNVSSPTGTYTTGSVSTTTSNMVNYHGFGDSTTAKIEASLPWSIDEVLGLDFIVRNDNTTPGEIIRVYNAFIQFYNIIVYNPTNIRWTRNDGGRS